MEIQEYQNIYSNESSHFYYISMHNFISLLLHKYLPSNRKNVILDAGCGTGLLLQKMQKLGQTYGVDISPEAIRFCHKRKLKNIQQGSILKLKFPKEYFDVITSVDVLYHQQVRDDTKAVDEFYRVLKPGGVVVIKVPALDWLKGHHDVVVHTRHRYTTKEIDQLLKKSGFIVRKVTYAYLLLFPLLMLKRLTDKYLPSKESSEVQQFPSFINQLLILIQSIEDRIMLWLNLPFGFSIYAVAEKPTAPKR